MRVHAARPYVVYFDNIKNENVTYYGEQVTSRSADYKTMPLGDFVNKTPTKLELTEDNELRSYNRKPCSAAS